MPAASGTAKEGEVERGPRTETSRRALCVCGEEGAGVSLPLLWDSIQNRCPANFRSLNEDKVLLTVTDVNYDYFSVRFRGLESLSRGLKSALICLLTLETRWHFSLLRPWLMQFLEELKRKLKIGQKMLKKTQNETCTPTSPGRPVNRGRRTWAATWWRKLLLRNAGQGSEPAVVSDV